MNNPVSLLFSMTNFIKNTTLGKVILAIIVLLLFILVVIPMFHKLRRRRVKAKETREIMKDLFTWKHLAQLVKGGSDHEKAKQELSDNILRINDLLKQGFSKFAKRELGLYANPWFIMIGEPRSGKSSLLEASDLELEPSAVEKESTDDGKNSLPIRLWTGAKAVVCDISGKIFFDRWLDGSSAEWNYIVKRICRLRHKRPLDGIIFTIPADALLADSDSLTSRKSILMATELAGLLKNCGMNLPCYVVVTKLDMVNGFYDYTKFIEGDLRHQIFGYENSTKYFNAERFGEFRQKQNERLIAGAKQLIDANLRAYEQSPGSRMDRASKIWTFPDTFNALNTNLTIYLDALFGEDNYHGSSGAFFEGVYFTSSKDTYISLSPAMALLSGKSPEDLIIPSVSYHAPNGPPEEPLNAAGDNGDTLMLIPSRQTSLIPINRKPDLINGYFIRDVFHKRIFRRSEHASFTRKKALGIHLPQYMFCCGFLVLGFFFLFTALFRSDQLYTNLIQQSTYYSYLDGALQNGTPFYSPLIREYSPGQFQLDPEPILGETLSSRIQFFHNAVSFRDMDIIIPPGFRLAQLLTDGIQRNYRYNDKTFIANQIYGTMVRMPVIRNVGNKIIENVNTEILTVDTKRVLTSFLKLDEVKNIDFHKFFRSGEFKLEPMLRYLIPDLSNDTTGLLNQYKGKYERDYSFDIDADYIYSDDFLNAKNAAINTIISAWQRYAVYPDSIYGKIKRLASISEEIIVNFGDINNSLRRINAAATLPQVREAVYEWKDLTDRQKSLVSEGRAVFAETKEQLRAAHIPLAFDMPVPAVNIKASGSVSITKPVPDAYRDNLINDYLFTDMVIEFAVKEYTSLFEGDMVFVRQKIENSSHERIGQIISLQGEFGNRLNTEIQSLRVRAAKLRNNELFADKVDEKIDSPSLFSVIEKVLELSSSIALPSENKLLKAGFETNWQEGQSNIKTALDDYDIYTADYIENKKLKSTVANARIMLLAESFLNRYTIFTTSLNYLYTFESNIAGVIKSNSGTESALAFSDAILEKELGILSYDRSYDPSIVKPIIDNIVSFASLFTSQDSKTELPAFLRNVDPGIYKPEAFLKYLGSYIRYWNRYPDSVYVPVNNWGAYQDKLRSIKAFQINAVLQTIYAKSIDALKCVDNSIINDSLNAEKEQYIASLNDKFNVLSEFLSTDAERMIAAWLKLSSDQRSAYRTLQTATEQELKETYMAVYTENSGLAIGWWNNFAFNGIKVLSDEFKRSTEELLVSQLELFRQYPLCSDGSVESPLSLNNIKDTASLFRSMGAGITEPETDPIKQALHPALFKGSAESWAQKIYQFSEAAADSQKPLTWTLSQPSIEVQNSLPAGGILLAANRFRYIEVKSGNKAAVRFSTYMNQKLSLAQGFSDDADIVLKFYRTSEDLAAQATVTISNNWAAFNLYFQRDRVKGNDEAGAIYSPIYVIADGTRYVYFVELSFNREIPSADNWNTIRTMPDIIIQDGFIMGNSFNVD
jgi:hypothetical protein